MDTPTPLNAPRNANQILEVTCSSTDQTATRCYSDAAGASVAKGYLVKQENKRAPLCKFNLAKANEGAMPTVAGQNTAVRPFNNHPTSGEPTRVFNMVYDGSNLGSGNMMRLCMDFGFGFGDTGLTVYVTGVETLMTTGIVIGGISSYYDMYFTCTDNQYPCNTNSMSYLTTACDETTQNTFLTNVGSGAGMVTELTEVVMFRIPFLEVQSLLALHNSTFFSLDGSETDLYQGSLYINQTFATIQERTTLLNTYYNTGTHGFEKGSLGVNMVENGHIGTF